MFELWLNILLLISLLLSAFAFKSFYENLTSIINQNPDLPYNSPPLVHIIVKTSAYDLSSTFMCLHLSYLIFPRLGILFETEKKFFKSHVFMSGFVWFFVLLTSVAIPNFKSESPPVTLMFAVISSGSVKIMQTHVKGKKPQGANDDNEESQRRSTVVIRPPH